MAVSRPLNLRVDLPFPPRFEDQQVQAYLEQLHRATTSQLRDFALQINRLSEGKADALYNQVSATPTTGIYARGDFLPRINPLLETATVSAAALHVVLGYLCVSEGSASAASFVAVRALTGE